MKHLFFILMIWTCSATPSFSIDILWDGGGDNVTWTDPFNWDCNCQPGIGDAVTILNNTANVIIPTGSNIQIYSLHSYQEVTIQSGAVLRTDYLIRLWIDGIFTNNGTINAYGEGMTIIDDHQVINNGTINVEEQSSFITVGGNSPNPALFTNNGTINFNTPTLGLLEVTSNSNFTNTVSGTINFNYNTSILNILTPTSFFINQGSINSNGRIINHGNFTNTSVGSIHIHDFTGNAITTGTTWTNDGSITIDNPAFGAINGLFNNGNYSGSGILNISGNNLINNTGTCTISGPANLVGNQNYGGIYNSGSLTFNNADWILDISGKMWNTVTGTISVSACKKIKSTGKFQNDGTFNNLGYLQLVGSGPDAYISTGLFTNLGVYSSNFDVPISEPTGNSGLHLPKIFGQQCDGTPIVFFFSCTLNGISNNPAGIYTTSGLTTSAGSFDYLTRTFTPNAACHSLTTLYVSFQKSGCDPIIMSMNFELPIYAPTTYYEDADFDGFGNVAVSQLVPCAAAPIGYVTNSLDCDDTNPDVYPDAPETCNDKDYNCDGMFTGINPAPTWYQDLDYDGYGNPSISIVNCYTVFGYVANNTDCDDSNGQIHPGAMEQCNNIDDDCDGMIDEDFPPLLLTFNGSVSNDWFTSDNWTPAVVPSYCEDVLIPTGMTVLVEKVPPPLESTEHAICRSISIATAATVTVINPVDITGGTAFGISNAGTLHLTNDSYTNIQYINGNGVQNSNTMTMSGNAILYISSTSQHSFRNMSDATMTIGSDNGLDMNAATLNGIYNSGTFNRNGFFNANNITGSTILNDGIFNNQDDLYSNAFGLPGWFVENLAGGVFNNLAGQIIAFPIPGIFYNVSDMGLINHPGATFHNYGTLQFFGHRIAGTGAFIQYAGSTVEGCVPSLGCP